MIKGHGGNIYEIAQALACNPAEIVDMSSNVSPLGMPPGLESHLRDRTGEIKALPEADSISLRRLFARELGLDSGRVLAGNGTTEFIYMVPLALKSRKVLIVGPTYSDYGDVCAAHGLSCKFYLAKEEDQYRPDIDKIAGMLKAADTVFVCNPNNPTGSLIPSQALAKLISDHPDVCFVVDESYMPFYPDADSETVSTLDLDNAVVLHSFSKIFCIPGLRLGFLTASRRVADSFVRFKQPWSVNCLAHTAGTWLIGQKKFVGETARFVRNERAAFLSLLSEIPELRPFPSVTNFVLFELTGRISAPDLCQKMAQQKILIRDCSNFYGLGSCFIRIALKSPAENRSCAERLKRMSKELFLS